MSTYNTFGEYKDKPRIGLFDDQGLEPIEFREEQEEAIVKALDHFCTSRGPQNAKVYTPYATCRHFLWNAKMRFGKTLCAHELNKRMGVGLTLIVTHRPDVIKGWYQEFNKIFGDDKRYIFASRMEVNLTKTEEALYDTSQRHWNATIDDFNRMVDDVKNKGKRLIFFVSMQYLRRSTLVGGDNEELLKQKILKTDWDLMIVDEAHEGTQTDLGKNVISQLFGQTRTKCLHLSGTPFNLYEEFDDSEIFTWDYIKEQQAKREWAELHPGEFNPYAELPHMNILTYNLGDLMKDYIEEGQEFRFKDFFQVWTGNSKSDYPYKMTDEDKVGEFIHKTDVENFLDLLCKKDDENNFPFSTNEYRHYFRHTLWVMPGVPQAKAMKTLLKQHKIFSRFNVINVAGEGDNDETRSTALDAVLSAIGDMPQQTQTITLSCARLTTGVTVKPWTAVLYMKGSDTTSPATYMQTIFRVQSPWVNKKEKWMKTECYVFDFLPNRMLNTITETAKFASLTQKEKRSSSTTDTEQDKENIRKFLKYCNVISLEGAQMSPYDAEFLFKRLHEVYIDRLVRKGFDDQCLYVQEELNKIDPELINYIGENGGKAPDETREDATKIEVVDLGHMTAEEREAWLKKVKEKKAEAARRAQEKARKEKEFQEKWNSWNEEEREKYIQEQAEKAAKREEAKKQREEFKSRITNIRGIALRIPLLMYGGADAGDTSVDLTVENFTRKIKDESWVEFMPKGITKEDFNKIKKCFNATRFAEAGKRIRSLAKEADSMHINDRIERIQWIFDTFRNPDKETVLTPWNVVNMHMNSTFGGYSFFNERFDGPNQIEFNGADGKLFDYVDTNEPRLVIKEGITNKLFGSIEEGTGLASRILEINSKTGLYPLYIAYTMYRYLLKYYDEYDKAHPDETPLLDNPVDNLSIGEEHAIWDEVVTRNIFVICNTPMAAGITSRTLVGFRVPNKKLNIKSDKLIERAKEDLDSLINSIKTTGYWNGTTSKTMINFDAVVGNPPYQGTNHQQIYPYFYKLSKEIGNFVSLIFPIGWQEPKTANNLGMMNTEEIKADEQIHFIDNRHNIFPKVAGVEWTNFIFWERGYNNELNGLQRVYTDGYNPVIKLIPWETGSLQKPEQIMSLVTIVTQSEKFVPMQKITSVRKPYGFSTDVIGNTDKYGLAPIYDSPNSDDDMKLYAKRYKVYYIPRDYKFIRVTNAIDKYKVFIPYAWGNMQGSYLGGAFSNIVVAQPYDVCTETFLESGCFDDLETARKHAKYVLTKFARALLFANKSSQHSTTAWGSVPVQDYSEEWWDESISELDNRLFDKYHIPEEIRKFVLENIQTKNEDNILM